MPDPPAAVEGNLRPASIKVTSNLADDTVFAGVMDIKPGRNTVAMFSNPFNGALEEMLYIDEKNALRWARHRNLGGEDREHGNWSIDVVSEGISEVTTAVHPTGSVWAFATASDRASLRAFQLSADANGDPHWAPGPVAGLPDQAGQSGHLRIQYLNDRPATPVVFFMDYLSPSGEALPHIWPFVPQIPETADPKEARWTALRGVSFSPEDVDSLGAVGLDPLDRNVLRIYALHDGAVWRTTEYLDKSHGDERMQIATGWDTLNGIWSMNKGAGCVGTGHDLANHPRVLMSDPFGGPGEGEAHLSHIRIDQALDDVAVWQDAETRLHVYGRGSDGGLYVLHQVDWKLNRGTSGIEPVWDSHDVSGVTVGTTRGLFPSVARYAMDAFPDDMPNQHVMHSGLPAGEVCAIYTQQVGTSFWAREQIRLVPKSLPAPYKVPRYETSLTVLNAFGGVVPNCQLTFTADEGVDLEVAGAFYRTSSIVPVNLSTDRGGQITIRVVAAGLTVPALHVTAPGLAQSVTVQQAAEVHAYLGGGGTLPNHRDGFTASTVTNAKHPDGSEVFPKIDRGDGAAAWPPTADDVISWCQGAFSVSSGAKLPEAITAACSGDQQVLAFSIQTHDPGRAGFQVYTGRDQLEARRLLLAEQGIFEGASEWFGDIVQGIRAGIVQVAEVVVHVVDKALEVLVELADGVKTWLQGAWDDVVSAAHAVESAFVALGAAIAKVVEWIKWAFDLKDVWDTKKALQSGMNQLPALAKAGLGPLRDLADEWFVRQEKRVDDAFNAMKAAATGRSVAGLSAPSFPPGVQAPARATADQTSNPHSSWMSSTLSRDSGGANLPESWSADSPFDKLIEDFTKSPAWAEFGTVLEDIGKLFTNLFNPADASTIASQELTTALDLLQHAIKGLLKLAGSGVDAVFDFIFAMLESLIALFNTPLDGYPLISALYAFIQGEVGISADQQAAPTVGDIGMLMLAYPLTLLYKIIWGAAPFPGGAFPTLPIQGEPEQPEIGNNIYPPGWNLYMVQQSAQAINMGMDCLFDLVVNADAILPDEFEVEAFPPLFYQGFAWSHIITYILFGFPPIWGYDWPPNRPPDYTSLPYGSWGIAMFTNFADLGCAYKNGYALAKFEDKRGVGPWLLTVCGIGQMALWGVDYESMDDAGTLTGILNLLINLASYIPGADGFFRHIYKTDPTKFYPIMMFKMVLDPLSDLFAGVATQAMLLWEVENPPQCVLRGGVALPAGKVNQPYPDGYGFDGQKGWAPYTFELGGGAFPPGIDIDADTGTLIGQPTSPGRYNFKILLTDDYGPSVMYMTDEFTIAVNA